MACSVLSCHAADTDVVLNELYYHPPSGHVSEEFIELYNKGIQAVDLSGWQFTAGVKITFASGMTLEPGGYLVISPSWEATAARYTITNVTGNYTGHLSNSGEKVELSDQWGTVIDQVDYSDLPPWPVAPDGEGPSLERVNPNLPGNDPANWRTCIRTYDWVFLKARGYPSDNWLKFFIDGVGEAYIDDVSLTEVGGTYNYLSNGGFEEENLSLFGWQVLGTHQTSQRVPGHAHSGNYCLQVISTGEGGYAANHISALTNLTLPQGRDYELSFWAKRINGIDPLQAQINNGGVGMVNDLVTECGTPGRRNSMYVNASLPAVDWLTHSPAVPSSTDQILVQAFAHARDGIDRLVLYYWTWDNPSAYIYMYDDGMHDDGGPNDGIYAATLPQTYPSGTLVRYKVRAYDKKGYFVWHPYQDDPVPQKALYVRNWAPASSLPVVHLIMTSTDRALLEGPGQNLKDTYRRASVLCDGEVYDGAGVRYRGNVVRNYPKISYKLRFQRGQRFKGQAGSLNLNSSYGDKSFIRETLGYDLFRQAGLPAAENGHARLALNNNDYGLFVSVEQIDGDFLARIGYDDDANLYKAYSNMSVLTHARDYELNYTQENNQGDSYADLIELIEGVNAHLSSGGKLDFEQQYLDIDENLGYAAVNSCIFNLDITSKNYNLCHDIHGATDHLWRVIPFDLDLSFGKVFGPAGLEDDSISWQGGTQIAAGNKLLNLLYQTSELTPRYNAVLKYLVDTWFTTAYLFPKIDALANQLRTEAANDHTIWPSYGDPSTWTTDYQAGQLKTFIQNRRNTILQQLNGAPFPTGTATLTPTPTFTPKDTKTRTMTPTPTATIPTATPSPTFDTPTVTETATATPLISETPTLAPTVTATSTKTATFTPAVSTTPTATVCNLGDADSNRFVNSNDYRMVRDHFGQSSPPVGDADCNRFVNSFDYRAVRDHFGQRY